MRKVCLFIAMSLDGYIGDHQGGVEWLKGHGQEEVIDSYSAFVKDIDTIIMGWNTYHQVAYELSPQEWIYKDFTTYVITHRKQTSSDKIRFVNQDPMQLVNTLKQESGKNIWICGGADLVGQLVKTNMIDLYYLTIIPTLLGKGIRLFANEVNTIPLRLLRTRAYDGMVDLVYERRVVTKIDC